MNGVNLLQNETAMSAALLRITKGLQYLLHERRIKHPLMIGIHTGGVWIANHLHQQLALTEPLGVLDIAFYRDDFTRVGINPLVRPSHLPVALDDRHLILVDDVLHTGRTVRAALNELFDYGRPASVILAVLAVRKGRELPIAADVAALYLETEQAVKLEGPEPLRLVGLE